LKRFCTAVNCMDGRVQLPVIRYLMRRFKADYVDMITEPGPNAILAERTDRAAVESIERRLAISVGKHKSVGIAVVGHSDCAGNRADQARQAEQTRAAARCLEERIPGVPVVGLWVNEAWEVSEINPSTGSVRPERRRPCPSRRPRTG
jgi:hypothetical protein